jgi:DnaJ-class molecular chaperone
MNDEHNRLQDILEERGLTHLFESDESDSRPCPGCGGKGRYVGFRTLEDPCEVCDGSGRISASNED